MLICEHGVSKQVGEFLSRDDLRAAVVYWVTYSVTAARCSSPTVEILKACADRGQTVIVYCMDPAVCFRRGSGSIRLNSYIALKEGLGDHFGKRVLLYGLKSASAPDDDRFGPVHAKWIVTSPNAEGRHAVAFGSFNLADNSLISNLEVFSEGDAAAAATAWNWCNDIGPEDCYLITDEVILANEFGPSARARRGQGRGKAALPVSNAPRDVGGAGPSTLDPARALAQDLPTIGELQPLVEELERCLGNWPNAGSHWQLDVFRELAARQRAIDLLYLPVGVGKTFIGLRWLLWQIQMAGQDRRTPPTGLFITPNEWIRSTVERDLRSLSDQARVPWEVVRRYVAICTPGTCPSGDWIERVVGVVADEVHNWTPRHARREDWYLTNRYAVQVGGWRARALSGGARLLGLSATPLRMDEGKFDVLAFVSAFFGRDVARNEVAPRMTRVQAVSLRLIVPLEWIDIVRGARAKIDEVLSRADGSAVQMGDYAHATLSHVWKVLWSSRHRRSLVEEVVRHIEEKRARRVVVFVPPVKGRTDAFVSALSARVRDRLQGRVVDFRSRGTTSSAGASEAFREFAASGHETSPKVLVTVDRFQEGISVTDIDMIVMLRATLSPRVAEQAIGRGVRLHPGKDRCYVLDAVGVRERIEAFDPSDPNFDARAPMRQQHEAALNSPNMLGTDGSDSAGARRGAKRRMARRLGMDVESWTKARLLREMLKPSGRASGWTFERIARHLNVTVDEIEKAALGAVLSPSVRTSLDLLFKYGPH